MSARKKQPGDVNWHRGYVRSIGLEGELTMDLHVWPNVLIPGRIVYLDRVAAPHMRLHENKIGSTFDYMFERVYQKWVTVRIETTPDRTHTKLVGEVWIDGSCVNDELIAKKIVNPWITEVICDYTKQEIKSTLTAKDKKRIVDAVKRAEKKAKP